VFAKTPVNNAIINMGRRGGGELYRTREENPSGQYLHSLDVKC